MLRFWVFLICVISFIGPIFAQDDKKSMTLSLKEALTRADEFSVNVLVAGARTTQSLNQFRQSQAALLPQLSATLNGQRQSRDLRMSGISFPTMPNYTGPFNTVDARARITQVIFDPGTMERLNAARAARKLTAVQYQKAKQDALALVAVLYIQAKRSSEEAKALNIMVARDARAYHLLKEEFKQGTQTMLELKRAKADLYRSRFMQRSAAVQATNRRLDLAAALQIDPTIKIDFDPKEDMALLTQSGLNDIGEQWDLKVAQEQSALAQAQLQQSKADNLPKVSLVGDYGRAGESLDKASNTYTLGIMASIPIWQGGSQHAKTAEAKAKADEAKFVYEDVKRQSSVNEIEAKTNIAKAQDLIRAEQAQADVSRQQLALVLEQAKNGLAQSVDIVRARAQKVYDEDQYSEAVAVLWVAKISLAKAQGRMQQMLLESKLQ